MVSKGGCKGWFQERTNLEKTLLVLSSLLLVTMLLLILFGVVYHGGTQEETTEEAKPTTCMEKECIETAGEILSYMDFKADPCKDAYRYACGRYGQKSRQSVAQEAIEQVYRKMKKLLETREEEEETFSEEWEAAKFLYRKCVEFDRGATFSGERVERLIERLMSEYNLGTWPPLDSFWDEVKIPLERKLSALTLLGIPVAFQIKIRKDPKESFVYEISPGGPFSGQGKVSPDQIRSDASLKFYMKAVLVLLSVPESRAANDVDDILSVEAYFANIQQDENSKCEETVRLRADESLEEMNRLMPEANWTSIMMDIWGNKTYPVELRCKEKIREYIFHLSDAVLRVTSNYLGWRFVSSFSSHLGEAFWQLESDYFRPRPEPRWKDCIALLENYAGPLLSEVYVARQLSPETLQQVSNIIKSMKSATGKALTQTTWLPQHLKNKLKKKVTDTEFEYPSKKIPFSSTWFPNVMDNLTLIENIILLQKHHVTQQIIPRRKSMETQNEGSTFLVTPIRQISLQEMTKIHFDKIQEPYMRLQNIGYLNYGGFGTVVAQLMSHFLLQTRTGPADDEEDKALLWDIWASNEKASSCFYDMLPELELMTKVVEENEMKRMLFHRSALELSYKAGKSNNWKGDPLPGFENFKNEQMFLIAYLQTFCEAENLMVNSSISLFNYERINKASESFVKEAFDCSLPSQHKCRLWG